MFLCFPKRKKIWFVCFLWLCEVLWNKVTRRDMCDCCDIVVIFWRRKDFSRVVNWKTNFVSRSRRCWFYHSITILFAPFSVCFCLRSVRIRFSFRDENYNFNLKVCLFIWGFHRSQMIASSSCTCTFVWKRGEILVHLFKVSRSGKAYLLRNSSSTTIWKTSRAVWFSSIVRARETDVIAIAKRWWAENE